MKPTKNPENNRFGTLTYKYHLGCLVYAISPSPQWILKQFCLFVNFGFCGAKFDIRAMSFDSCNGKVSSYYDIKMQFRISRKDTWDAVWGDGERSGNQI